MLLKIYSWTLYKSYAINICYLDYENCQKYGNISKLCFKWPTRGEWSREIHSVAITTEPILEDMRKLLGPYDYWLRGTNMRWVWITGMSVILIKYININPLRFSQLAP